MSLWPQYVYLGLICFSLGLSIADHGRPRERENAWVSVAAVALSMFLLWQGGFFKGFLSP